MGRDTPFLTRFTTSKTLLPRSKTLVLTCTGEPRDYAPDDSYDGEMDGVWEGKTISRNRSAMMIRTAGRDEMYLEVDLPAIDMGLTFTACLLYTSPSPRDMRRSRMPSSA